MRLICPNCDAEYEVDATVIPLAGRDVQCSNCGHAWFQAAPGTDADLDADEHAEPARRPVVSSAPARNPADSSDAPPLRGLDASVLAVLREEAEREAAARRAETGPGVETQTEMGLVPLDVAAAPDSAARRVARMKGVDPDAPAAKPTRPATRRDLLPEIDEINSTLRATSERRSGEASGVSPSPPERGDSGGFRSGFALMLLAAVVLVALYAMAPRLAELIPEVAPAMAAYVAAVDAARLWIDTVLQAATDAVRGLTGGAA